ncbi:MAG: YfcE family phosphodiesterase [Clostridia bacterium]
MKRVIALSDSHGFEAYLRDASTLALMAGAVDAWVFLGDGLEDFEAIKPSLRVANPQALFYAVRGNNDWSVAAPAEALFSVNGVAFYACHGHAWHVKYGLERLCYAAREREAKVAFYGHTHYSHLETEYGVYLINPGAVCERRSGHIAYAEVCVADDGGIRADLARWP